ncbi:hypothetical protein TRVA0_017S02212 [Trichomonascus vanleenenianus]|uniref:uncharacterized protein n=1 Tax=Trichomonascus vanleenenianus TaxID=2268995 RepID=UPI003ECA7107
MEPLPQEDPQLSSNSSGGDHNGQTAGLPPVQSFVPPVEAISEPFSQLHHQPEHDQTSFQDVSRLEQSSVEQSEQHVSAPLAIEGRQNQAKVPYKSFKKKYRKMEAHFSQVMARSDELHAELIRAQRLFNRLLREKSMLTDLIMHTNTTHLAPELQTIYHLDDDDYDDDDEGEVEELTEQGEYYNSLLENSFEYSDDEKAEPLPNNPVSLLEWLRRNQPSVLAADQVFDKPPVASKKKLKTTMDLPSAASMSNSKKRKNPPPEEQLDLMSEEERKKKQPKFVYY